MSQVIDISEPGMWETISSYYQSTKHWEPLKTNPLFRSAAKKELGRYRRLKEMVLLGNQAA